MAAALLPGNQVTLLECGVQYFPALIAAIDAAQREVHLETYIYALDPTGEAVTLALTRAAARGCAVRVLVDGFGGRDFADHTAPRLRAAGVEVLIYRQELRALRIRRHRLRRLHRKLAVIDARVAFVGGINVIDDYDTPGQTPPRFDYAVRIEGPLLGPIHTSVRRVWWLVSWAGLRERPAWHSDVAPRPEPAGAVRAAFVIRNNLRNRRDIENAYLEAIGQARREIVIANAYFLPGRRFRQALIEASRRGCNVVLLLQGRVEYLLMHYATRALYPHLLAGGVRIFEYHRSFLHAKVAVCDGHWATVGSSNIDPFSLMLAREANVVVRDVGFARELRDSLEHAMQHGARELRLEDHRRAPWYRRFASWGAYMLVRAMMGIVGVRRLEPPHQR
ncbi:cardiolipin synthase ClsB [Niveibacterium umoris]|uniref:Cardiolipin synthase B n=1 Tax=Niveibacterium umoris TaxID=1193620 RepID=A0A840BJ10_9RHOO|nr:cardiolipin synthase ClsB [Niveibacterium umoris]MBB4012970.1 cardiolipin synthase [Niveibacterium umoris]